MQLRCVAYYECCCAVWFWHQRTGRLCQFRRVDCFGTDLGLDLAVHEFVAQGDPIQRV